MDNSIVYNQDCVSGMKNYSDKSFKLAIPDPPYFSGPEKREYYGTKISTRGVKRINYPVLKTWELPTDEFFKELFRVSVNQIIWGANYFDFGYHKPFKTPRRNEIDQWVKDNPKGWIVWDKVNGKNSFNDFELAWTSFDYDTIIFTYMWNGMMQGKSTLEGHIAQGNKKLNEKRIHQTQKPINIYKWQLDIYANKGDNILDTHVGSGSLRLASFDYEFTYIGFELSPVHYKRQELRFNKHISQQKLKF